MEEIIDILDIPIEELQTRAGNKILAVFKQQPHNNSRLVVFEDNEGYAETVTVLSQGYKGLDVKCEVDIIRKPKKVLYIKTLEQLIKDGANIKKSGIDHICVDFNEKFFIILDYDELGKPVKEKHHTPNFYSYCCEEK